MPNFHIFTMVWGDHHIDLFKRACFRSLNWPKNQELLRGKDWFVYTKSEHFDQIRAIFKDYPFQLKLVPIAESMRVAGCGFVKASQCDAGVVLLNGLRDQIAYSLQAKSKMLFAPPDTLFGDGTIPCMIGLGQDPHTCVAVAHPRVLPKVMEEIEYVASTTGAFSNPALVKLALKHPHASFQFAEIGHKNNNSYVGGIAWRSLGEFNSERLISVTHRLPTPYFLGFHGHDWDFWWGTVSFGALDHSWPGDRLIRQERMRYAGSSDACFIVEITDHDKNVPPIVEAQTQSDEYWGDRVHHSVNRLFNVIWRG